MGTDKNLKNYLDAFDNDLERTKTLVSFAKTAIKFICEKKLYVEFLQYHAGQAMKEACKDEKISG